MHPATQRVDGDPELLPDPRAHPTTTTGLITGIDHEPNGTLLQLGRILLQCWHAPHAFGTIRASIKPGARQTPPLSGTRPPSLTQEALSSSRIEGTQASLSEVLSAESAEGPVLDENLREVDNYLAAARQGMDLLETLPLTPRFFCLLHETLMTDVRGEEKSSGELRTSPVWIGSPNARPETARFVPPHQSHLGHLLADREKFVNETVPLPILVKCALMHYQFETIHPFLDGNGRIGRLLIGFMLVAEKRLPAPGLNISGFLENNRQEYDERLQAVREKGAVDEWIQFFCAAVTKQANDSATRIRALVEMRERYRSAVRNERSALPGLIDIVFRNPVITVSSVQRALNVSQPTASAAIKKASGHGWVQSMGRWGRGGKERWLAREIWTAIASPLDQEATLR